VTGALMILSGILLTVGYDNKSRAISEMANVCKFGHFTKNGVAFLRLFDRRVAKMRLWEKVAFLSAFWQFFEETR
jgi:hypothetical protein